MPPEGKGPAGQANNPFLFVMPKGLVTQRNDFAIPITYKEQQKLTKDKVVQHMEKNIWVVTHAYGDNYYDVQKGSTLVLDFDFTTGLLSPTENYSNDNPTRHLRVFNTTGVLLERGDQCLLGYRGQDIRQKPFIKSVFRRPFGQQTSADPNPPIYSASTVWRQSEGNIRKDNLGLFLITAGGGLNESPGLYPLRNNYNSGSGYTNAMNEGVWPQSLLHYGTVRIHVKPVYTATEVTGYHVYFYNLADDTYLNFAHIDTPSTVLDYIEFGDVAVLNMTYLHRYLVTPNSFIYLNEKEAPGKLAVLPLSSYLGTEATFKVLSVDADNLLNGTGQLIEFQTSTLDCHQIIIDSSPYYMGTTHISVSDKRMIQGHIACEGIKMWQTNDYLEWTLLQNLLYWHQVTGEPGTLENGYSYAGVAFTPAICSNNSIPRYRTDLSATTHTYTDFIYPIIRIISPFASTLHNCQLLNGKIEEDGSGNGYHLVMEETNVGITPTVITSVLGAYDTAIGIRVAANYYGPPDIGTTGPDDVYFGYYECLEENGTEFYSDIVDCTSPCFIAGTVGGGECMTKKAAGCKTYGYNSYYTLIGTQTTNVTYGGMLTSQIATVEYGTYPSYPITAQYKGFIFPLPAGVSNNINPPSFERHRWGSYFENGAQTFPTNDPAVVFTETGRVVQAALRSKPVTLPSAYDVPPEILTSPDEIDPASFPQEGDELCAEVMSNTFTDIQTGCDDCLGAGGFQGPFPFVLAGARLYPEGLSYGNRVTNLAYYWLPTVTQVMETVLIISSEDRTSYSIAPISGTFNGATYPGWIDPVTGPGSDISIAETLPVPENVWQIIPVADKILVLMDFRPTLRSSPRPCLRCYSLAGALLFEYTLLVPQTIQDEVYEADETLNYDGNNISLYADSAKWFFHGRHANNNTAYPNAIAFSGDTPGPRMKATWPGRDSEGALIAGDTMVYVSCELYERKKENPPYDFKSRIEYRILKLNPTAFEVIYSSSEEYTENHVDTGEYAFNKVKFIGDSPRPYTLVNMAPSSDFFEFVNQNSVDPTQWDTKRKEAP